LNDKPDRDRIIKKETPPFCGGVSIYGWVSKYGK
jgi:hypothetical protein